MSILITGAHGQLGQTLRHSLTPKMLGMPVYACEKHELDVTNQRAVREILAKYQPRWVCNTAAFTSVDAAETQQALAFNLNVNAVRYLAEECAKINAKLLHFSTGYVFSGANNKPYVETDPVDPQSIYGETKWLGEQAIITSSENYIILRVSWLFGPYGNNFVKTIVRLLREKDNLRIVSDQQGSPTFTRHISLVVKNLITNHPHATGIFHYSDAPHSNWYEFAHFIQQQCVTNYQFAPKPIAAITAAEYPTAVIRPKNSMLDCGKILKLTGMSQYGWQTGVTQTLKELLT